MDNHNAHHEIDSRLVRRNLRTASTRWGTALNPGLRNTLSILSEQLGVSVEFGDLLLLQENWYITHSGLLRLARRKRCSGIQTETISEFCDPQAARWVVKATVFKTPRSKGFVGYGDADPSNVSPAMHGAEMRIAETRAVNRALRKAYGIGLCSVEELGAGGVRAHAAPALVPDNHNGNGQPRLRDRLLLLIRQYQLDAEQVKLYAAHFCGTASLRETSREQIESFLEHLNTLAAQGRDQLVEELQSVQPQKKTATDHAEQANNKEAA